MQRGDGHSRTRWEPFVLAAVLAVAFVVRVRPLLELDRFGLMGYDQAAYFAGARALTLGYLPYRDFVHVQPPGVLYFLAPFSPFGTWGFTVAKIVVAGLGVASTALIWWIARRWCGLIGGLIAAATYALYRPSIAAHRYLLIEPLVTVSVLGAIAMYPRENGRHARARSVIAGVLLAIALSCKFFAVVPIAALAVSLLLYRRSRVHLAQLVVGFGVAALALVGPWLAIAPTNFVRYTISDQSARTQEIGRIERLLETFWYAGHWPTTGRALAAALVAVVVGLLLVWGWSNRTFVGTIAAAWATFGTAFLLLTPQYFDHYAELVAPPIAILIGGVLALPLNITRPRWRRVALVARGGVGLVLVVGAVSTALVPLPPSFLDFPGQYASDHAVAERLISGRDCVVSDSPEIALIVPGSVAYAVTGNGPAVDPFATAIDRGTRVPVPPASLNAFKASLSRCSWFATPRIWSAKHYPGWTDPMKNWLLAHYELVGGKTRMELWHRKR